MSVCICIDKVIFFFHLLTTTFVSLVFGNPGRQKETYHVICCYHNNMRWFFEQVRYIYRVYQNQYYDTFPVVHIVQLSVCSKDKFIGRSNSYKLFKVLSNYFKFLTSKKNLVKMTKPFGPETITALGNLYVIFVKLKSLFHFLKLLDIFFGVKRCGPFVIEINFMSPKCLEITSTQSRKKRSELNP